MWCHVVSFGPREVMTRKRQGPQVLAGSAQPALVGVMPNIWPGFVDQVVDKRVNGWKERTNEWMNASIQRMLVFKVQRGLVPTQFWAKQKMVSNIAKNMTICFSDESVPHMVNKQNIILPLSFWTLRLGRVALRLGLNSLYGF